MRFTSKAFIISAVALLSLITPVVNADVASFTTPASGQQFTAYESIEVTWTVTDSQGLDGVNCDIAILIVSSDPFVPASPGILQSGVPILNGKSNGPLNIGDLSTGDVYFMQLLSDDQNTVFAQSGDFTIHYSS